MMNQGFFSSWVLIEDPTVGIYLFNNFLDFLMLVDCSSALSFFSAE